jgi:3-deoxy-manno-octulosonate cytidylyltransferase (CMP-KDO synthetase)
MIVYGVIPARFQSTRFPGKPLKLINGQPLLSWVIQAALKAKSFQHILVATDDERIAALAKSEGVEVAMTPSDCATGTDRVWQAIQAKKLDVAVNIQGDEPLIAPDLLDRLATCFENQPHLQMATLGRKLDQESLVSLTTAKIIVDQDDQALYFSRLPIPYSREKSDLTFGAALKHIGMYAYRKDFLEKFCQQAPVAIEIAEGLEQLRALYLGAKIKVLRVESESWGVDTPEDVQKIEKLMRERGIQCPKSKV